MCAAFPDLGLTRFNAHWPKISSTDLFIGTQMHPFLSPYLLQPSPAISPNDVTLFMVNRYTLHSSPVQTPHTKDAIFMVTSQNVIADIIQ